jgi:hypothetical protein
MLTPEQCWYQKNADTRGMLTRGMQQNPGTRKTLVSAKFWCQQNPGTRKILVPEKLWCQQSSGVSKILVPEKS